MLKPRRCPHCGGYSVLTYEAAWDGSGDWTIYVECEICEARGMPIEIYNTGGLENIPEGWEESNEAQRTIRAWNMRVKE